MNAGRMMRGAAMLLVVGVMAVAIGLAMTVDRNAQAVGWVVIAAGGVAQLLAVSNAMRAVAAYMDARLHVDEPQSVQVDSQ